MHVDDRWTRPGASGRPVRTERWGRGKRWRARWTEPGGREREKACATRDEAEAFLARLRVDIDAGAYVPPDAGRETFKAYAERWRAHQLHHRPSTAEQAESRLRLHVYPTLGARPLSSIRRSDVQALVAGMAGSLAPSTVEVVYGYVASIFKAAVDDRVIPASPCTRIALPELVVEKVQPLTVAQVERIKTALPERYRALAVLAAASGMRSAELRGLTVDRLTPALHLRGDRPPRDVTVRVDRQLLRAAAGAPVFGPPKTKAGDRSLRIGAVAARVLAAHLERYGVGPDGLVFTTSTGRPVTRSTAGVLWRDATDGMGLRPRSGWHELRHFHASLLIAAGLSVRAVADRLGHEDPAETLRTYAHLWPDDEDRAVAATEAALAALGKSADGPGTGQAAAGGA